MKQLQESQAQEVTQDLIDGYEAVTKKLSGWAYGLFEMLPNIVVAVLLLIGFYLLGKLMRKYSQRFFHQFVRNDAVCSLLSTAVFYFFIFEGLFLALNALELEQTVTQLLAGAGIIGLALSFAFQSIATNIISGVIIAVQKPLKYGDLIRTGDYQGVVKEIGLRVVTLRTFEGEDVFIPSKDIIENPLLNFTHTPYRRLKLEVGVSYGEDLERVEKITVDSLKKLPFLLAGEEILLSYSGFGDSSINFEVFIWIDTNIQREFLIARSEAVIAIKKAYDANDITIPFPIRTLDFGIKGGQTLSEMQVNLNNGNGKSV